jgi:hypothetical protein
MKVTDARVLFLRRHLMFCILTGGRITVREFSRLQKIPGRRDPARRHEQHSHTMGRSSVPFRTESALERDEDANSDSERGSRLQKIPGRRDPARRHEQHSHTTGRSSVPFRTELALERDEDANSDSERGSRLQKIPGRRDPAGRHEQHSHTTGRSSARLERLVWDQEVGGSNPLAPTWVAGPA